MKHCSCLVILCGLQVTMSVGRAREAGGRLLKTVSLPAAEAGHGDSYHGPLTSCA